MDDATRILVVEDQPFDAELAEREIRTALGECSFERVEERAAFLSALESFRPDLVVSDYRLPRFNGMEVIQLAAERAPTTPVIVLTGAINEDTAVECMKAGACDYVIKEHIKRLGQAVVRALDERRVLEARAEAEEARSQAELEIAAWKRRYELFAAASKMVFYDSCTADGSVRWSQSAGQVLGFSAAELGGGLLQWRELIHPEDRAAVLDAVDRSERAAAPLDVRYRIRHKAGHHVDVHHRGYPARNESGGDLHFVGVIEDVTEHRRLEAQLLQAQKMEAIGRLAGGIAHDFNNMTSVVLGYAEFLKDQLHPLDPMCAHVEGIILAAQRSASLTRQLLAFARKQVVAPVVVSINDVLENSRGMVARLVGEDVAVTIRPAAGLWNVRIDPTQVDQILANLATNARDAIEDVGSMVVETSNVVVGDTPSAERARMTPGEYVQLSCQDSGRGMDEETRARVFEPFFTTKGEGHGTGLGLATVFGIVRQNGGHIFVDSEPARGTTFRILLPRSHDPVTPPVDRRPRTTTDGSETILLVEDDEQLLRLSTVAFRRHGYNVLPARSAGDAIMLCERHGGEIHLLVTDVVMPGMNGRELQQRVLQSRPGVKTLFMSGYTADIIVKRGILEQDLHFIQKPFKPKELVDRARELLDQRHGSPGAKWDTR